MNDDTWSHVATFCDVKTRGRIYNAHKHIVRQWNDLILFHTGRVIPLGLFKDVISGEWEFVMAFARLGPQMQLRSGKPIACWSPWCSPYQLQLHGRGIRVYLNVHYNEDHARFILWIRRLVCAKRQCSLMHLRQLVCSLRWTERYKIPVREHSDTVYIKYRLLERPFRVKLAVHDSHHPVLASGYPKLYIQCFEFRGIDIRNEVGKRMLLTNE